MYSLIYPRSIFNCILLGLLVSISPSLYSQTKDIRLAPELRDYSMPEEAKIESVAKIGSRHLVAWGTTAFDADSNVINVILMQMLENSTPLLTPKLVHSDEARPYGFVLGVATNEQFVLFWNDRRADAPGTYMRRFDINGNATGDEERIDIGAVVNDPLKKPKSQVSTAYTTRYLPIESFVTTSEFASAESNCGTASFSSGPASNRLR